MNSLIRSLDSWLLVNRPVKLAYTSIGYVFLATGLLLIFVEALFYDYFSSLARSSFSTRRIIGFHLFPSEIWFIVVGNALLFLAIGNAGFRIPRSLIADIRPLLVVLAVYSLWFVYGSLAGNSWALQEFREMVFAALCLPPVVYFSAQIRRPPSIDLPILLGSFAILSLAALGTQAAALIVGSFFAIFFTLKLLYRSAFAGIGLAIVTLPFLMKFSKPAIAHFAFCVGISFLLAAYFDPNSRNWILSRFKLKVLSIGLTVLAAIIAATFAINELTDGLIEDIIRFFFLKERLSASGETTYADVSGGRVSIWKAAIASWADRPILGYGLGAEIEAYSTGWITKTQFHNYVVQALHNTGILGTIAIFAGWAVWIRRISAKVYRTRDVNQKIMKASMLIFVFGLLFFGLYGHSFAYPPTTLLFWIFIGLLSLPEHRSTAALRK